MTSYRLKCIAIAAMTIDHFAKIFGQAFFLRIFPEQIAATYYVINVLEWIGRLAFPVFAYMIAEGCVKTRSLPRYIGRLALFALISQPFYYFAFHSYYSLSETARAFAESMLNIRIGNVFTTLMLGAAAIYIYQLLKQRNSKKIMWLMAPALIIIMLGASYFHADYEAGGVLLIFMLYLFKSRQAKAAAIVLWSIVFYVLWASWSGSAFAWMRGSYGYVISCAFSCLSAVLLYFYNGKRGRPLKWTFYIYYPAHLFVLTAINFLLI